MIREIDAQRLRSVSSHFTVEDEVMEDTGKGRSQVERGDKHFEPTVSGVIGRICSRAVGCGK